MSSLLVPWRSSYAHIGMRQGESQVFDAELFAQVVGGLAERPGTPLRRGGHSDTGNAVTA
jgi:hypothetical protein